MRQKYDRGRRGPVPKRATQADNGAPVDAQVNVAKARQMDSSAVIAPGPDRACRQSHLIESLDTKYVLLQIPRLPATSSER